jgi:hypothetical protein
VSVFLYENGRLSGPAGFSTLGMRIQNENSGSTSLFAHPVAIEPIPEAQHIEIEFVEQAPGDSFALKGHDFSRATNGAIAAGALAPEGSSTECAPAVSDQPAKLARGTLEARMEDVLAALAEPSGISPTLRQGHLALLKRWYYRPEARRSGEIFFPDAEGRWPIKALLRGVGRVAGKMLVEGRGLPPFPR